MLTLLALVSTALAADDPLADEIRAIQADVGGQVLLCVAGEAAEQATRRTLRDLGQEDLPIVRVPTVGDVDAEMARALSEGGLPCALRIAPTDGGFDLSRHGECDAAGPAPGPDAPEPALLATRDAKARAEVAAPEPAAEAPAVVTEAEWATREARYQRERLMLVDLPPDPLLPEGVTWEVVDGRGSSLSARSLVTIAQDEDLGIALDRELDRSRIASKAMFWTGIGLALLSPVPLIGIEDGAISENQDRAWSSVFLLASGGLTLSLSRAPQKAARARQAHPALYLDGDMAEDVVVLHNHRLYGSLDLENRPPPPEEAEDAGEAAEGAGDAGEPAGDADEAAAGDAPAPEADAGEPLPEAEDAPVGTDDAAPADDAPPAATEAADDAAPEGADTPPAPDAGDAAPADDGAMGDDPAPQPEPKAPAEAAPTDGGEGAASDR